MIREHDYIVVGSGPSGAMAAQTLVEAGADTAILDVGFRDQYYKDKIPDKSFLSLRKDDPNQHLYFLGKQFEGIPLDKIKTGPQLTATRKFVVKGANQWLPTISNNFDPLQSLAYGGLGNAWGLACFMYSRSELNKMGLDERTMLEGYQTVANRIGISATSDDASPFCVRDLENIQPPTKLESHLENIYSKYKKTSNNLNRKGFFMGRTALAMLTKDLGERKATEYYDMDFWSNQGKSAYRPDVTIDELRNKPNFTYYGNCLVTKFVELDDKVKIMIKRVDNNQVEEFICKKLILAAGTLSTARIVIRSFDYKITKLPILCNNYCYFPCLQFSMLGKPADEKKVSYSQLALFYDKERAGLDVAMVMLYTYRSLLLFRLAKEMPLGFADGINFLRHIYPSLVLAGLHHPEKSSPNKFIQLIKDDNSITGDKLLIEYRQTIEEIADGAAREREIKKTLRKLGCYPLKQVNPGYGASIHYGGSMPFSNSNELLTLSPDGRLGGTKNVYVADGSGFRYLPSKGPTLTLMANAHLVALNSLKT